MSDNTCIADGLVVIFHYTLTDDEGAVLDSSKGSEPMPYLHGAGNIVPGLERAMLGHVVGDAFKVDVAPADGYGERSGRPNEPVPRGNFPEGMPLHVGMNFAAEDADGQVFPLWIADVTENAVIVTHDHPLAGQTLHFDVEIVGMRAATAEEQTHGHPHGIDGTAGHGHSHDH